MTQKRKKEETEKTIFDHITDWFRELKTLGVAGLLVGLGFVLVFVEAILYGSNPTVGFWVVIGIGVMMILLGVYIKMLELKNSTFLVTFPQEIGDKLGLKVGDKLLWVEDNGKIYIKKA